MQVLKEVLADLLMEVLTVTFQRQETHMATKEKIMSMKEVKLVIKWQQTVMNAK